VGGGVHSAGGSGGCVGGNYGVQKRLIACSACAGRL